jgi:hypothetical protein
MVAFPSKDFHRFRRDPAWRSLPRKPSGKAHIAAVSAAEFDAAPNRFESS